MATVVYASKRKKFRSNYPLTLKLRHGVEFLNSLDDHGYRNILIRYADELIYRTHRGKQNLRGKYIIATAEKITDRYLLPIYPKYRHIPSLSFVTSHCRIVFWEGEKENGKFVWHPTPANMVKVFEPKEHLKYKYKYKWTIATKGPVEAELIKVDGAYSLAPWLVHSYKKAFKKCELCGRLYGGSVFYPAGWYPRSKKQFDTYCSTDEANYYYSSQCQRAVCGGPCKELMRYIDDCGIKLPQRQHKFLPLSVTLGVIDYVSYNPHLGRLASDFIRYARPIFEARSNSTGCKSHREIVGQYLEVSRD